MIIKNRIIIFGASIILAYTSNISSFNTIDSTQKIINELPEYPCACYYSKLDGMMASKPEDYIEFYRQISGNWFDNILRTFKSKENNGYVNTKYLNDFINLLKQNLKYYENQTYEWAFKKTISKPTRIIVIGSIYAEVHSLIRDLIHLKARGIIDDDFTIKDPNTLLIMNGNAINVGYYSLETLLIILKLMQKNRSNFIYIYGREEYKAYRMATSFKQELSIRLNLDLTKTNKFTKLLDDFFFNTPLIFFLETVYDKDLARFSSLEITDKIIQDSILEAIHVRGNSAKVGKLLRNTKVIIRGSGNPTIYETDRGLYKVRNKNNIIEWIVFSSPLKKFRFKYDFFFDAYAEIKVPNSLKNGTITYFYNDLRSKCGFMQGKTFNLLSGTEINTQVPKSTRSSPAKLIKKDKLKTINLGSSIDLSGRRSIFLGEQFKTGIQIPIIRHNQERSDNQPYIKITILDNEDNFLQSYKNFESLIQFYKSNIILCPTGLVPLTAATKFLEAGKIFIFFPQSGSSSFRRENLKNIVHFRAPLQSEGKALASHMLETYKAKRIAIVYQNDEIGMQPLHGAKEILNQSNISPVAEIQYNLGTNLSDEQISQLKKSQPEVIGLWLKGDLAVEVIKKIGLEFFSNIKLYGTSALNDTNTLFYLKYRGIPIVKSQVVPNPNTNKRELVQEYRIALKKFGLNTNIFSLEAYIATSIALDILKKIPLPVTPEKIRDQIKTIKNYNFKGFTLNFNHKTNQLNNLIWINDGGPEWIEKEILY